MSLQVKICCIKSIEEGLLAIDLGACLTAQHRQATAIGLVGPMPSGPGVISLQTIRDIVSGMPDDVNTFLLTSEVEAEPIIAQHRIVKTTTIQLVDEISIVELRKLKSALRQIDVVQVIHVQDESSVARAKAVAPYVDALLLDSGNPDLAIKELGGTGRTHNWDISQQIVEQVTVPVYLAGGIRADNVVQAIKHVRPYGVDLCTGVRTNDALDKKKLKAFFEAISSLG